MADTALIIKQRNTSFEAITCDLSECPEIAGTILLDHYSSSILVDQLISHGDLRSLAPEIQGCGYVVDYGYTWDESRPRSLRDTEELFSFLRAWSESEHLYLFTNEMWKHCRIPYHEELAYPLPDNFTFSGFRPLIDELNEMSFIEPITKRDFAYLAKNGCDSHPMGGIYDATELEPVVKLQTLDSLATWLLVSTDPNYPDLAYGLRDLGTGCVHLGNIELSELKSFQEQSGLTIECDSSFTPTKTLGEYADEAKQLGRIAA